MEKYQFWDMQILFRQVAFDHNKKWNVGYIHIPETEEFVSGWKGSLLVCYLCVIGLKFYFNPKYLDSLSFFS